MLAEILPSINRQPQFLPTNNVDLESFKQCSNSLEQKLGRGYNVLAEVDLFRQNPNARDYVFENELTAACEAAGSGHGTMWSAYRPWDARVGQFRAFGQSFISILEEGVRDIRRRVENEGEEEYRFELNRRQAELNTERSLTSLYQQGRIRNNIFLTISPYPEEVGRRIASSLGYKPDEQLGKLRFEVFVKGVRQTVELGVERGSLRVFQSLIQQLGFTERLPQDSTSLLRTFIPLGDSANYLDTVIDVARRYDSLIEAGENNQYYFCGQRVESKSDKDYEKIISRQRWVREQGRGLITATCDLDMELARSLSQGRPTEQVMSSLRYWADLKDQKGVSLLSTEELDALNQTIISNQMSRDSAFVLKKNELVRMWSVLSCVINEERAKQMFGEKHVQFIQGLINGGMVNTAQARRFVDQIIAEVNPIFLACGGSVGGVGQRANSLFSVGLTLAREALFGAVDRMGSLYFECPHVTCRRINKRDFGQIRESCQHCHQAIPRC